MAQTIVAKKIGYHTSTIYGDVHRGKPEKQTNIERYPDYIAPSVHGMAEEHHSDIYITYKIKICKHFSDCMIARFGSKANFLTPVSGELNRHTPVKAEQILCTKTLTLSWIKTTWILTNLELLEKASRCSKKQPNSRKNKRFYGSITFPVGLSVLHSRGAVLTIE